MLRKRECRQIESLLWGYAASRLSQANESRVGGHLAQCVACREQLAAYQLTAQGVTELRSRPIPPSRAQWQEVCSAIQAEAVTQNASSRRAPIPIRNRSFMRPAAWGSAAMAAVLLLVAYSARPLWETPPAALAPATADKQAIFLDPITARDSDASLNNVTFDKTDLSQGWAAQVYKTADKPPAQNLMPVVMQATASPVASTIRWKPWRAKRGHWRLANNRLKSRHHPAALTTDTPADSAEQVAMSTQDAGGQSIAERAQRNTPEYVLTALEANAATPREYVMDGVNADTARGPQGIDRPTTKEIRAW